MITRLREVTFVLLFMMISVSGFAQPAKKDVNTQLLSEKMEFFYINPDPFIAQQMIREIADLDALDKFFYFFVR